MKKKILFIIPSLEGGGAEKVLFIIAKNLAKKGYNINVVVITNKGIYYDKLPSKVHRHFLNSSRLRYSFIKVFSFIRKAKPDIVFCFNVNHLSIWIAITKLFLFRSKIKFIVRESTILSILNSGSKSSKLRSLIDRLFYPLFDFVIAQSNFMKEDLIKNFNVSPDKVKVINNPVEVEVIKIASQEESSILSPEKFNILAIGRLVSYKGFHLLAQALSLVNIKDAHLTIVGEATLEEPGYKEYLLNLIDQLHIQDKITFCGFLSNPFSVIASADLFVVSSKFEGFPNVALEAITLGIPVVAYNSPGGIAEIIKDGFNGILVDYLNINKLALAIENAASMSFDKNAIKEDASRRFSHKTIIAEYENTLQ